MRLKSIKLAGFKSFVDPTTVNFPSNMCAVVGPNGCGKSNVIDAVRWVMGESSAKNLRGESMTDVIFNGSVNRQPVGQASIELVFDNTDGGVGGEYASYAEISIKRQVSREGQSEYFLNGTKCRRRDITDIFLGTGLGPRSYAIIEQGMISRLIESKPEELRIFIEEAAGISKYKERRKETESRMRRTLENLERLTDLREELERQLSHLKRQAAAAEKYAEYKEEERSYKAQLQALQWQELDGQVREITQAIGELEVKLEAVHAEHQNVDTSIEQYRVEHTDRTDAFNKVQGNYYALGSEVARIEQTIKHQQERSSQLQEDLQQTSTSLQQAEGHLGEDRDKLVVWEEEIETLSPELEMLQEVEEASAEALVQAEEAMHTWQNQWDQFNHTAAAPRQQAEVQQSRIQHLEQVLQRLQDRTRQLEQEREALAPGPADDEIETLGEQIAEIELVMAEHENSSDTVVEQINSNRQRSGELSGELNDIRSSLQQLRGRQASLEALQQAAMEDGSVDVGEWLQAQQVADKPRLLEQLQVDDGWQLAVETVLGDYLQAVCVDDLGALGTMLGSLEQGQLALVEGGAEAPAGGDYLMSKVRSSGAAWALLAGVKVADDLAQAMAMRAALTAQESIITRDGVWVGPNWLRVTRLSDQQGGVIARQQELEELEQQIAASDAREEQVQAELARCQEEQKRCEEQRENSQRELQVATRQHAELGSQLSAMQAKVEQISARRERLNADIDDAREQFRNEQESIAEARQLLSEAIESMESDSQRREDLLSVRDETRGTLDTCRQKARHDKDASHQAAMRHQSLRTQLDSMRDSIDRTNRQVAQLRERRDQLQQTMRDNDNPLDELQEQLEAQLELRLQSEGELTEARQAVSEVEHKLREAEQQRAGIEHRAESVRSQLEKQRLSNQSLQVQRENIHQQLRDAEQDLEAVLSGMPEEANQEAWQRELERIANRIARLGPINLAAIDEYNLQSERKNYLDAQNDDLETALNTLENAIRKIDKETRNRFQETFDKVNTGLQELFPRVFGGGSAYLEMTGEDLLDTGISIMARPPGKKNSTIHLLSGGEKALTAIALVFSIFQLNPAPFCMLDEVDAPLDDANTGRYARMVKEMSEKVQFIYITHNKISMEQADQLMGVTMHEPGVSRLVTVDVEEAAELAAS
ncbi:chromosome segregation protein SMC [Halioglobus sp. HI00S01]|uniref:chromosome segregation protein SMC n=1 Tax=Halioglobus sp. HI00S01 TaxID=1822214 RepID=UPI0007C3E00C|nr:chromosome segregation protein SMC [Halioglobus sp. HI00S01]KZX53316.1 chromosome segregation protein SMC [Halioglobus sp. HI00S01]